MGPYHKEMTGWLILQFLCMVSSVLHIAEYSLHKLYSIHYNLYILTQAFILHSLSMYLLFHNLANAASSWWFSLFLILSSSVDQLDLFSYQATWSWSSTQGITDWRLNASEPLSNASAFLGNVHFLHSPTLHKPSSVVCHVLAKPLARLPLSFQLSLSLYLFSETEPNALKHFISYFCAFFMLPLCLKSSSHCIY